MSEQSVAEMIPNAVLTQHIVTLGKTRSGKSSTMRLLVERLLDLNKPVCIIDPKGDWWGLKSSADGKRAGYPVMIFGGEHADWPLNEHAGAAVAELLATGNRPAIIDLGGWMVAERTRFFIRFASTFFRLTRGPHWLAIDEVHNFAPQGKVFDPDAGKMLHWANRLASEGAGRGITLISASQRPQKVHKDFLTSNETLIAKRVIHPLDRGAIKDWIDGCGDPLKGKEVLDSLAGMKRADGWVWSPEAGFGPILMYFPLFKTYDSFAAPTGPAAHKLTGWASVDMDEVRLSLAAVAEEAKRNDPALLQAEIAKLKRELATKTPARASPELIAAAEQRGFAHGWHNALNSAEPILSKIDDLNVAADELRRMKPKAPPQISRPHTNGRVSPAPAPQQPNMERLSQAKRLILTALAQYQGSRTKNQVAVLTGYAVNGGGFNNAISSLRTTGYIITGHGDQLDITDSGLAALGSFDPLPTGPDLLDHWMRKLPKAQSKALHVLVEAYPEPLPKDEVAARAGYKAAGGGFTNAISRLRTLELISGRGELRASEHLF
jgi:hypothetical protein